MRSSSPLPRPIVALTFLDFSVQDSNVFAHLSFTNLGKTEVCLWDSIQLWQLEAETPTGWITNTAPFASVTGEIVLPNSNRILVVPVPTDAVHWRVTTIYGFAEQRHLPTELYGWIWRSAIMQRGPEPIADAIAWCLDWFPDPPHLSEGEISTQLLTNTPPRY